jgi:hypothetical protein
MCLVQMRRWTIAKDENMIVRRPQHNVAAVRLRALKVTFSTSETGYYLYNAILMSYACDNMKNIPYCLACCLRSRQSLLANLCVLF